MPSADLERIVSNVFTTGAGSSPAERSALVTLLAMLPGRIENPVGNAVASAVLARAKRSIPGGITQSVQQYGEGSLKFETGTFAALFYPSASPDPNEDLVGGTLEATLWSPLSVAVLCQRIYHVADTRRRMRKEDIDRAVNAAGRDISGNLWRWYMSVFRRVMPEFAPAAVRLGGDREAGRRYAEILRSDSWIAMTNERIRSGQAGDMEWSLYHHWIKLLALTGDYPLVMSLAGRLANELISFPARVRAESWPAYRVWFPPAQVDHTLFREADTRILMPIQVIHRLGVADVFEGYSMTFLQEGPGKPYWDGARACLAAGAGIRMADGTIQRIETLRRGEVVATPSGARAVAAVVAVPREGRPLFSLSGCAARFTSMHALRSAERPGAPRYLAIEARRAGMASPTFQGLGLGRLERGAQVLAHSPDGPTPVTVEGLTGSDDAEEGLEEPIYDLLLEPDETGISEYFVGDDRRQILVSSDLPIFTRAPLAARAALGVLAATRANLARIPPGDPGPGWSFVAAALADGVISAAARRAAALAADALLLDQGSPSLVALVAEQMGAFVLPGDLVGNAAEHHASAGRLVSHLLCNHAEELEGAIEMGWRRFPEVVPGEALLAVSVLSARLDAEHTIPPEIGLGVSVAPAGGSTEAVTLRGDGGAGNTRFVHHFHDVAYFDSWPSEDAVSTRMLGLDFQLRDDEGAPRWVASGRIAWPPRGGYRHANAVICTAGGVDCGVLVFDVRLLSRQEMEQERVARAAWDPEQRARFAEALGRECGLELDGRLAQWLEAPPGA